ncbi:MAG TPA: GntR family transcriptional regulator [Candidatus Polarisedimenticolaceae bacterium]|nr:GntR family transcriptional regulator [Candidatus Polarisedimenticolaceae bacterium]
MYLQLAQRIQRTIVVGGLHPGDRLPTVRELAARSGVNRNTAARAIEHLEREGIVHTRIGRGTFAATPSPRQDRAQRDEQVDAMLDRLVLDAVCLGVPPEELGWRLRTRIEVFRRHGFERQARREGHDS